MNAHRAHHAPVRSWTSRCYETEHDLQQMQRLLMEARSRADDWHYWHVGDLTWGFCALSCHVYPHEHIRLWHDAEGKLVGYAVLGEDPSFDCQVLPEYAWSGIETAALAWAQTRLAQLRQRDADQSMERPSCFRCAAGRCKTHGVPGAAWIPARRVCRGASAALVGRADSPINDTYRLPRPRRC